MAFYQAAIKACQESNEDLDICPSQFEKSVFESFILPLSETKKNFVIITAPLDSLMSSSEIASHEIMHAEYFLYPDYRAVVDQYWAEHLSEWDRNDVRKILADIGYDPSNDLTMRNEFQAYVLMAGALHGPLASKSRIFRFKLETALIQGGVAPIQIH